MLEVGRGMNYEENKAHFSLWCTMAAPVIMGNDLTTISKESLSILINKDLVAIDRDQLVYQGRRFKKMGDQEICAKPLGNVFSDKVAVVLFTRDSMLQSLSLMLTY